MHSSFRFFVSVLALIIGYVQSHGQGNSANVAGQPKQAAAGTPDAAWAEVVNLARVVSIAKSSNDAPKTKEQMDIDIAANATRYRHAAQAAKDFYTANPSHTKAREAQKIETLGTIRGAVLGNVAHEFAARTISRAYRDNRTHSVDDRFEVALAMERLELSIKIRSRQAANRPDSWKKIGDDLKVEFGDVPALQAYFMDVARTADNPTATKIASDVQRSAVASAVTKARAQAILDRNAMLGKGVALRLATIAGTTVDLAQPVGQITVIVAWSPDDPSVLAKVKRFEKSLPVGARMIYLAMGGTASQVRKASASATLPGTHCHAPAGPLARAANDALKLPFGPMPRVYVLKSSGAVFGFGAVEDLPTLLRGATG